MRGCQVFILPTTFWIRLDYGYAYFLRKCKIKDLYKVVHFIFIDTAKDKSVNGQ